MDDLIFASAKSLAQAIRERKVSSVEVIEAHLKRIDAVNPMLNAVVQIAADRARNEARNADELLSAGRVMGPLHGVPVTIKDNLDTEGIVSTGGTIGRAGFVPDRDATAVARFRAAGAIILGKTNTPELTLSFETDNDVYGRTSNPYDQSRMSGGSSGGAAAIIAAGGSPLDIGSDTGGSIRLPAHFCGVAGIRPTSGRVPRTGHIIPPGGAADALTQLGPIARFVEDLTYTLPILIGPDWQDPAIIPMPMDSPDDVDIGGLRIAMHTTNGIADPTPDIAEAVSRAAKALEAEGASVDDCKPEVIGQSFDLASEVFRLGFGDAGGPASSENLLRLYGTPAKSASGEESDSQGDVRPTAKEVGDVLFQWDAFRSAMLTFMEGYDLMVGPVNASVALPHGGIDKDTYPGFSYTMTHNLTGWPGAVVRVGTTSDGLPIGVQLVARPWREDVALAAAQLLETVLGGWQRPSI